MENVVGTISWGRVALSVGGGLVGFLVTKKYITKNKIGHAAGIAVGGTIGYMVYPKIFSQAKNFSNAVSGSCPRGWRWNAGRQRCERTVTPTLPEKQN